MATESSRTFDLPNGAVHVGIKDSFGTESFHTFYVAGIEDVPTAIAQRIEQVEAQSVEVRGHFAKAGWVDSPSS